MLAEDAEVEADTANPTALQVLADGVSGPFSLAFHVSEPDDGSAGDITKADVTVRLVPIGSGATVAAGPFSPDASGNLEVAFEDVPVNVYLVEVSVGGGYYVYEGVGEDAITIYNPASGSSSGGGWFTWPSTDDKTSFGFTGSYAKRGGPRGDIVLVRHADDGNFRLKSNAVLTYAVGATGVGSSSFGWATLTGKCTYIEPGWDTAQGNYSFTLRAEDYGEPGAADRIWIEVKDRNGAVVTSCSLAESGRDRRQAAVRRQHLRPEDSGSSRTLDG